MRLFSMSVRVVMGVVEQVATLVKCKSQDAGFESRVVKHAAEVAESLEQRVGSVNEIMEFLLKLDLTSLEIVEVRCSCLHFDLMMIFVCLAADRSVAVRWCTIECHFVR